MIENCKYNPLYYIDNIAIVAHGAQLIINAWELNLIESNLNGQFNKQYSHRDLFDHDVRSFAHL